LIELGRVRVRVRFRVRDMAAASAELRDEINTCREG
jgi:hypothetical protein